MLRLTNEVARCRQEGVTNQGRLLLLSCYPEQRAWMKLKVNRLSALFDVRKGERTEVLLTAAPLFLVLFTFWIFKPIKRGLFLGYYKANPLSLFGWSLSGAETEQLAKVANVGAAYLLMLLLAWLGYRFQRREVVVGLTLVAAILTAVFSFSTGDPSTLTVWAFYIFGDMFNTAALVLFWAFVSDAFTADRAKRLYGLIGLGGVLGGLAGSSVVRWGITQLGRETVLRMCLITLALIAVFGLVILRRSGFGARPAVRREDCQVDCSTGESWTLFRSSRYLVAIAVIVICYEVTSSVADFQFSATVERTIAEPLKRDAFFGTIGQLQSLIAIFMQLFLTGLVMSRFGVGAALLVLPSAMLLGTLGYLAVPTLLFAAVMSISDNSMSYSINQTAKEALYVPLGPTARNTIKTCIDVLIQRFAKVLGVAVNLVIVPLRAPEGLRWISLVSLVVLAVWMLAARFTGRQFDERAAKADAQWRQWRQLQDQTRTVR